MPTECLTSASEILSHLDDADPRRFWTAAQFSAPEDVVRLSINGIEALQREGPEIKEAVHHALSKGHGFGVISLKTASEYTDEKLAAFSHRLAAMVGDLMTQTEDGQTFFEVTKSESKHDGERRLSMSAGDTSLHTDCSYGDNRPGAISLFCLHPAKRGGSSILVSAYTALRQYVETYPEDLAPLAAHYPYYRSHVQYAGQPTFGIYPFVEIEDAALSVRYKMPYMIRGYREAGLDIPDPLERFLHRFEAIVSSPDNRVDMRLARGDFLVASNSWILHNRTPYQDAPDGPKRLLIRHWIDGPACPLQA
ncbi:TauD/TfdA family dioxygenase [Thalassococcus sp. S3]|uniref:TauD/TfdA family dioxygenase n=1 Tax=Thalassococcus sp. S3 TaxID=2017482 RepID=UPI0010242EB8|nr:TauD/TfdA family dioxygenase [Thalassococcus sp. S3]QBF29648.1 hypothetical protein CFI11_00260 [Thalassococcus sp. S3]